MCPPVLPRDTCHVGGTPAGPGADRHTDHLPTHRARAGGYATRTGLRRGDGAGR
jgi:hypothetical protein